MFHPFSRSLFGCGFILTICLSLSYSTKSACDSVETGTSSTVAAPSTSTPPENHWLKVVNTENSTVTNGDTTAIDIGKLANRSYYLLPADGVCSANDPLHTKLQTWRTKVSFEETGQILDWETLCNDSPRPIPWSEIDGKLSVSPDLSKIYYANTILTYSEQPPQLCPEGIWCPTSLR